MERLLLTADPSPIQEQRDTLNQFVTDWFDRPDTSTSSSLQQSPRPSSPFHKEFAVCFELLGSFGQNTGATIVVPDTNALVRNPTSTATNRSSPQTTTSWYWSPRCSPNSTRSRLAGQPERAG